MTQPALDFFKKRGLLVKAEVTEGTDSVPVVATNGILLLNGRSGTEFDKKERQIDRPFFTSNPFSVANKRAFIEGGFELYCPATPGAASTSSSDVESILLPSGMAVVKTLGTKSTKYNPISASIPSVSAYWWHVDAKKIVLGARCNISNLKAEIGERMGGQIRIQGNYTSVTEEVLPTNIVLPTTVPVVATYLNSKAWVDIDAEGGGAELLVWAKSLEINFNNELASKEYTSVKFNTISDRMATWTMRIARADLSPDLNPWTLRDAATIISAKFRTFEGADPGRYSELGIRGQIETVEEVEIDKDLGWELSGPCIASNTGGDEFYIEFKDNA